MKEMLMTTFFISTRYINLLYTNFLNGHAVFVSIVKNLMKNSILHQIQAECEKMSYNKIFRFKKIYKFAVD